MTESLKEQLMPQLEKARTLVEEISQVETLADDAANEERGALWSLQYRLTLIAIVDILRVDINAEIEKAGVKASFLIRPLIIEYDYHADLMCDLHHTLLITGHEVVKKDTLITLSREESLHVLRNLARRQNARLAKEHVPLFVFFELAR